MRYTTYVDVVQVKGRPFSTDRAAVTELIRCFGKPAGLSEWSLERGQFEGRVVIRLVWATADDSLGVLTEQFLQQVAHSFDGHVSVFECEPIVIDDIAGNQIIFNVGRVADLNGLKWKSLISIGEAAAAFGTTFKVLYEYDDSKQSIEWVPSTPMPNAVRH